MEQDANLSKVDPNMHDIDELSEKFACVFPGQGSQSIGMMDGYADFPGSA